MVEEEEDELELEDREVRLGPGGVPDGNFPSTASSGVVPPSSYGPAHGAPERHRLECY